MTLTFRVLILFAVISLWAVSAVAAPPAVGDTLPAFTLEPLPLDEDAAVLGLQKGAPFSLADIGTPYVMIEVIGVYCAFCHEQAPSLTRLFKRLQKAKLDSRITMLGIAAGATPMEVKYVREHDYVFPVTNDSKYEIYGALSEPKTPFTMIVDKQGKVLYVHRGVIPDINAFFQEIKELVQ